VTSSNLSKSRSNEEMDNPNSAPDAYARPHATVEPAGWATDETRWLGLLQRMVSAYWLMG